MQCRSELGLLSVGMVIKAPLSLAQIGASDGLHGLPQLFRAQANLASRIVSLAPSTPRLTTNNDHTRLQLWSSSSSASSTRPNCLTHTRGATMATGSMHHSWGSKNQAPSQTVHTTTALNRWSVADKQLPCMSCYPVFGYTN